LNNCTPAWTRYNLLETIIKTKLLSTRIRFAFEDRQKKQIQGQRSLIDYCLTRSVVSIVDSLGHILLHSGVVLDQVGDRTQSVGNDGRVAGNGLDPISPLIRLVQSGVTTEQASDFRAVLAVSDLQLSLEILLHLVERETEANATTSSVLASTLVVVVDGNLSTLA
jgi:hypothetical protein